MTGNLARILVAAALLVGVAPTAFSQDAVRIVDGRIDVRDEAFKPVFLDVFKLYPGTDVTLEVEFRVDVMRRMFETRECWSKWFGGIDCKYVKQSEGSGIKDDRAPLVLELFEQSQEGSPAIAGPVKTMPAHVERDDFDPLTHLPPGTKTFSIQIEDADIQDAFTRGYVLKGRVAPKYKTGDNYAEIVRRSCNPHRNNEHCSQGQYVVHIEAIDTTAREKLLERYLARKRSYSEISSPDVIDRFMTHQVSNRKIARKERVTRAAELLVQHATTHYSVSAGANEDLRQILEYAVSLDPENGDARNLLVQYHISSGNLSQAKEAGSANLQKFNEQYQGGNRSQETLRDYAGALRNGGQIMLKDRAATELADVEAANGFYEKALTIWAEYEAKGYPINEAERLTIAQMQVDQARVLGLIRTTTALHRAIDKLELARLKLPKTGRGTPTAVSGDGMNFLTASFFQPLAEVGGSRVQVGYLPTDNWLPIQVRRSVGEVLLSRINRSGGRDYSSWSSSSGSNEPGQVFKVPVDLQAARFFGKGLIGIDRGSGHLVRVEDGKVEVVSAKLDAKAQWQAAEDAIVAVVLPASAKEPITVWREGTALTLDIAPATAERAAISASGKHIQILQISDAGKTELRLVDVEKLAKGEADASAVHDFAIPESAKAELLFTQNGQFSLQRGQNFISVLPISGGGIKVVKFTSDPATSVQAYLESRLAILPKDDQGMTGSVTLLDAENINTSGVAVSENANAPSPTAETLTFLAKIPSDNLLAMSQSSPENGSGIVVLLARELPAVLHVHSFENGQRSEHRLSAWRHGDAVLLTDGYIAIRDRLANKLNVFDNDGSIKKFEFDGGMTALGLPVTEIVPLTGSKNGGFFHIARDQQSGSVVSVTAYLDAKLEKGIAHVLPQPVPTAGGSKQIWTFLRQPLGHISPDQARLTFITVDPDAKVASIDPMLTRQEYDNEFAKTPSVLIDVLEVDQSGQISTEQVETREPSSILARIGKSFLQRRETGLALIDPDGKPVYLDECGSQTQPGECDGARITFPADGESVMYARQGTDSLELTLWTVKDGQIDDVWRCKACRAVNESIFAPLENGFVGALPKTAFAADQGGHVLAPYQGVLGLGGATEDSWPHKIPFARPVAAGAGMALVQPDGATFQLWRTAK